MLRGVCKWLKFWFPQFRSPEKKSVSEILFGKFVKIHSNVAEAWVFFRRATRLIFQQEERERKQNPKMEAKDKRCRGTDLVKISRKSRRDEKFYFRHRSMLDLQP